MNPQLQSMLQQAVQAIQGGNIDRADSILRSVLQGDPKNVTVLHILGGIRAMQSNHQEAIELLQRAIKIEPKDASLYYDLAKVFQDAGANHESLPHHKKAIALAPNNIEALLNYGVSLSRLSMNQEALDILNQALSINANFFEAIVNKSVVLKELKQYSEALEFADKALSINSNTTEVWANKAVALNGLKRYDEAIAHYDKALSLKPDCHEAWSNKGVTLHELRRYDEAITHYDKALSLKPDYHEAWSNKGVTLHELRRYDEAITHYDKALSLKPDIEWIYGDSLHMRMSICSWSDLEDFMGSIPKKVRANEKVFQPFPLLALSDDAVLHKKSSEIFIESKYPFNSALGPIPKFSKADKIRVGYFSADFHNHATGHLIAELFELHDKNQFELIGFSFGPTSKDQMRQRLEKSFDQFIEVVNNSDMEVAQLSRDLKIDIAVDLKGFTKDARTGIFAHRAAPIQVNYLGYPGTMGADYIDYIIADKTLIPDEFQTHYSEKVVYLPNSYQVNDRKRLVSDRQFTRQDLGLPDSGFVFCCFNNNYKILPATFDAWIRILKAVEGSVLWLLADNILAVENLKKEAVKQGVDPQRLVFANKMPQAEHLARHYHADLFLDTLPYNAHTTTSDALWAGLPVLTLLGQSFASRVAASLLNAIGLPELITNTQEEYEALAIELAITPQKLADIKMKLIENRLHTPLFDTPLFTKNLESAYIKMIKRYQADLQPEHIIV